MQGSRSLYLNARSATFSFGYDDFSETNSREIAIRGQTDYGNPINTAGIAFTLKATEVADDFKYDKMKNPDQEYQNEEPYCYGTAIILNPSEFISETTLDVDLSLTFTEFSYLKDVLDKFFVGAADFRVRISVIGMELGFCQQLHKLPEEHKLPVVGYTFVMHSKEIEQLASPDRQGNQAPDES